jgi:sterol O-acyltransferase
MDGLKLSKMSATFVTFLLSALCHELVMAVVSKKIRPYLFLMQVSAHVHHAHCRRAGSDEQMAQIPMIVIGRIPAVRRNKTVGNIVFWMGLMLGFPAL